jgi:WD40 repeat protein
MSDGYAYLWDVKRNERIAKFIEFGDFYVKNAYFSSDDRFVITSSFLRKSEVTVKHWWDARTGKIIKEEIKEGFRLNQDKSLAIEMSNGYAYLWDVKRNEKMAKFIEFGGFYVENAYFSSDDRFVITESFLLDVKHWDARTGTIIKPESFLRDENDVRVKHWWDARTGEIIKAETAGIDNY